MRKSCSFRKKLILSILSIVSLLLLCSILIISTMVNREFSRLNENYSVSAFMKTGAELKVMMEDVLRDFTRIFTTGDKNLRQVDKSSYLSYVKAKIKISQLFDLYVNYDLVALIADNSFFVSAPGKNFVAKDESDELYQSALYQQLLQAKDGYGTAALSEFMGYADFKSKLDPQILYFTKRFSSGGKRYTLVIGVQESQIRQTYLQLVQEANKVFLVDGAGRVLSSSETSAINTTLHYYEAGMKPSFDKEIDGQEYQVMSYSLGIYDWTIINQYPTAEYHSNVNRVTTQIFLVSAICILLMALVIYAIVRKISSPLYALSRGLQQFSADGMEISPPAKTYVTEIDILNENFSAMTHDIAALMRLQQEEQKKKNRLRMQALMAQINPHFISNTLSIAKTMAELSGSENVSILIRHIIGYISPAFRIGKNRWTYAEEYTFLQDYIYILEIRFAARLKLTVNFDPKLRNQLVPRFLVQPLIENSVFHGMDQYKTLEIQVEMVHVADNTVRISVTDNGIGIAPEILNEKQQMLLNYREEAPVEHDQCIGILNVKQRLSLYYPGTHQFELWSVPGQGTRIVITIPYR